MPDKILEEKWTRWYPEKIFFKNIKNSQAFLYNSDYFIQKDFTTDCKIKKKHDNREEKNKLKIKLVELEAYKKGLLEGKKESKLLIDKINKLFLEFDHALFIFEEMLYNRLLKIILVVSSYIIGQKIEFNKTILLNYIKKTIEKDGIFSKNPKIIIHPSNKTVVEKILKKFLSVHSWEILCDSDIDLNSFKFQSEKSHIDTTMNARWYELSRIVSLEECS